MSPLFLIVRHWLATISCIVLIVQVSPLEGKERGGYNYRSKHSVHSIGHIKRLIHNGPVLIYAHSTGFPLTKNYRFNEDHIQDCSQSGDEIETDDNHVTSHTEKPDITLNSEGKTSTLDKTLSLGKEKMPDKSLNSVQSDSSNHLLKSSQKEGCSPIQCLICMVRGY